MRKPLIQISSTELFEAGGGSVGLRADFSVVLGARGDGRFAGGSDGLPCGYSATLASQHLPVVLLILLDGLAAPGFLAKRYCITYKKDCS